jgi:hypothetical protein
LSEGKVKKTTIPTLPGADKSAYSKMQLILIEALILFVFDLNWMEC